ncbi:MAG: ABC-F family ATP-binding cassette domain-containing protein [Pseudomonadota bacterium]
MSALTLSLTDINLTFGSTPLFEGAELSVGEKDRIALVGRNGAGKSTLLKMAAGLVEPDNGDRFAHPSARIVYLAQETDFAGFDTPLAFAAAALDNPDAKHLAARTLEDAGVDVNADLAKLSGGEAKRVAIAAAFAQNPDVLLLDEPTNHLDIAAIAWLENTLSQFTGAIVVISHDRRFLERLTTKTVWIDRGATRTLDRGFSAFEEWRDKLLEEEKLERHKLSRKIAAEEDWVRYGVTARRKRNVRRLAELKAMRKTLREARGPTGDVAFAASQAGASGKRVITAKKISKAFGDNIIVQNFSVEITRGEKVGIVAANGAGKTTLLNMLIGRLPPDSGEAAMGANVELVTLDQRRAALKPEMRLADAIADGRGDWVTINGAKKHVAAYLQDFLFAPEQWRAPVSSLSGGEQGRLALAAALAYPSNLLALDEPTNDLDLETLDLLEDMLSAYEGAVLLISHDRSFIDRLATSVITTIPEKPGGWRRYPGGYDDMASQRGSEPGLETKARAEKKQKSKPQKVPPQKTKQKLSYKEKYALETLPEKIAELEKAITEHRSALDDPSLYKTDPDRFKERANALEKAEKLLAETEDEWLAIAEKAEAFPDT